MVGEPELTDAAERVRYENSLLATGALFVVMNSAPGIVYVDISEAEPVLIVGFDFLKSEYRITVEQIVDDDGTQADRTT